MAWGFGVPCPKSGMVTRLEHKDIARKDDEKALAKFRAAVWLRDGGLCRLCGRKVKKTLTLCPERAEVHHIRGRNVAPADRYNVKAALLLCRGCHEKAQQHKVTVPKPE